MPVTATPDGRVTRPARADTMCDAREPVCPQCGRMLLGRSLVRFNVTFMTCDNHHRPPGQQRQTCGQHVMLIPYPDDMVRIVGLQDAEFVRVFAEPASLRTVLQQLGMVSRRR